MTWDIALQIMAAVFLVILLLSIKRNYSLITPADQWYTWCIYAIFALMITNTSAQLMGVSSVVSTAVSLEILYTLIFAFMPLVAVVFMYYLIASMDDTVKVEIRKPAWLVLPYAAYLLVIAANPLTHMVFSIGGVGFESGPYVFLTYAVTYLYSGITLFLAVWYRAYFNRATRSVYYVFPLISLTVTIATQLTSRPMLLEAGYVVALYVIYLFMQNVRINTDPITMLGDKNSFTNRVKILMREGKSFTAISVNIRRWGWIREGYGRQMQNDLAVAIADYLEEITDHHSVFRRDEIQFIVLLDQKMQPSVNELLAKLQGQFKSAWEVRGLTVDLQAGVGVLTHPGVAQSVHQVDALLDHVMALASRRVSNDLIVCDTAMLEVVTMKEHLIKTLVNEVEAEGFSISYQPIFTSDESNIRFLEAFVRLPEGPFRELSPSEFVPVAQEVGLMRDIGNITLEKVCKFLKHLIDNRVFLDGVSVNVSLLQVSSPHFVEDTIRIIEAHQVPFSMIVLELAESVFEENTDVVQDAMKQLGSLGIRFILDNFGSGHANINHILLWNFDGVKFDKVFVRASTDNATKFTVMTQLAAAFRESGIVSIAAGVETPAQDGFVKNAGCEFVQGYYYAMPCAQDEIEALLSRFASRM